ncbi:MAG TPA: hypothetical protein DIT13_01960, partial [Verrucomicrobiales bacterium]|nr:hypothetical protein [Verrucomicrobiales bacterium]
GGAVAAPIVKEVFTKFYEGAPTDDPLVAAMKDVPLALAVDEGVMDDVPLAQQVRPAETAPPPQTEQRTLGGFFRRLFKRSN